MEKGSVPFFPFFPVPFFLCLFFFFLEEGGVKKLSKGVLEGLLKV
jgi:hypothetical protein